MEEMEILPIVESRCPFESEEIRRVNRQEHDYDSYPAFSIHLSNYSTTYSR